MITRSGRAYGRRELEAMGATEEIKEMERETPKPTRRTSTRLAKKETAKEISPPREKTPTRRTSTRLAKKESPKEVVLSRDPDAIITEPTPKSRTSPKSRTTPKDIGPTSPVNLEKSIYYLDKDARKNLCRDLVKLKNINSLINYLGLIKIELLPIDRQKNYKKIFRKISNKILDFCLSDISPIKVGPLNSPEKFKLAVMDEEENEDEISLINRSYIKKIGITYTNLFMISTFLEQKYKHLDICFLNPYNYQHYDFQRTLSLSIEYTKGKENDAKEVINGGIEDLIREFIKNCKKRYVVGFYLMRVVKGKIKIDDEYYHTNAFIYDKDRNFLQLIEPYGFLSHLNYLPDIKVYEIVHKQLGRILPEDYGWRTVNVDFQDAEDKIPRKKAFIDPWGYCMYWSAWLLEEKLQNLDKDITKHLTDLKPTVGDLRRFIRGYAIFFAKMTKDFQISKNMIQSNYDLLPEAYWKPIPGYLDDRLSMLIARIYLLSLTEK